MPNAYKNEHSGHGAKQNKRIGLSQKIGRRFGNWLRLKNGCIGPHRDRDTKRIFSPLFLIISFQGFSKAISRDSNGRIKSFCLPKNILRDNDFT